MLNNPNIIQKLSEEQKIALVTDISALSDDAINVLGVPRVERTTLDALNREVGGDAAYPSVYSLANSWNTALVEQTVGDLVRRNGSERFNVIGTTPLELKLNPYSVGIAEDPYLCAKFAAASTGAIEQFGGAACLEQCHERSADIEYLGQITDSTRGNILTRAFVAAVKSRTPSVVAMSYAKVKGERDINFKLAEARLALPEVKYMLTSDAPEEVVRKGLSRPKQIFCGASAAAVRSALKNYRRMREDVEHGAVSVEEFDKAMAGGTAVSDEMLDEAVDKVIDFAASVKRPRVHYTDDGKGLSEYSRRTALAAAEESIVLLKNDGGALPLGSGVSVATIGDLANAYPDFKTGMGALISAFGAKYVGHEPGYKADADRSDELISPAADLAMSADITIVFVGLGAARESHLSELKCRSLPANQLALLSELSRMGKRIIAVAMGDILPATKFEQNVSALLYAPRGGSRTLEAIARVLFGAVSPSGKLACTGYYDPDTLFKRFKSDIALGRYKMGEYVGYRRYVSERSNVKYPFGYGLSYAQFEYSSVRVDADGVEVTVRNTSDRAGAEVAQLYVGKRDSALLRPLRELKGFAKVMLEPGKAVQIKFPVNAAMLEVIDPSDGRRKSENGAYELYIGASSTDIRLTASIVLSGVAIAPTSEQLSDYLPALTNIQSGGYTMKTVAKTADKSVAFKSARTSDAVGFERLFAEEFGDTDAELEETQAAADNEYYAYVDDSVTVDAIVADFTDFAASHGVVITPSDARDIFGAMFASRVTLFRCSQSSFDAITTCLCDYFGCPYSSDNALGYTSPDSLFGHGADTGLASALEFARAHREIVTFSVLDNVVPNRLSKIFTPFIMYATAPDDVKITVAGRITDMPANVWFLMREDDSQAVKDFPAFLADMATVLAPEISLGNSRLPKTPNPPDYFRMIAAMQKAERHYEIEEPLWKRVDKLESFVRARAPFGIDNKMCVQMEKMIAVALSCGSEEGAALDSAMAAKLMPRIACALKGKLSADDGDLEQALGGIFGDEDVVKCVRMLKRV